MKIYLDDLRPTPYGWERAYTPDQVISLLERYQVDEVSLDHDLGLDNNVTGYDVLKWIEWKVATTNYSPPEVTIHTSNPAGRQRMLLAVSSIKRIISNKEKRTNDIQD